MTNVRRKIPDFEEELQEEQEQEQVEEGLPPRSEVHRDKKKKFKINHFFVRVLTFLFILLPICILWYTDQYIEVQSSKGENETNRGAFEVIFFDSNKSVEQKKIEKPKIHIVKEGETLESIGEKYFPGENGAEKIEEYNHLQNRELEVGQKLKIPITNHEKKNE